jgi:hypothetical protein
MRVIANEASAGSVGSLSHVAWPPASPEPRSRLPNPDCGTPMRGRPRDADWPKDASRTQVELAATGSPRLRHHAPGLAIGNNRAFTAVKKFRGGWNLCAAVAFGPSGGGPTRTHQGVRRMAGTGRLQEYCPRSTPRSTWRPSRPRAGSGVVSARRARLPAWRPRRAPTSASSIAEFPSATSLPYDSKIAERSWCGHDTASALVTSCRLSSVSRLVSRLGGYHATQQ